MPVNARKHLGQPIFIKIGRIAYRHNIQIYLMFQMQWRTSSRLLDEIRRLLPWNNRESVNILSWPRNSVYLFKDEPAQTSEENFTRNKFIDLAQECVPGLRRRIIRHAQDAPRPDRRASSTGGPPPDGFPGAICAPSASCCRDRRYLHVPGWNAAIASRRLSASPPLNQRLCVRPAFAPG